MATQDETLFEKASGLVTEGPVECLGLSFINDEERRAHFTQLLREKLADPQFRSINGFPAGEAANILELSDPPYFTACPNPWLADFVAHFGKPYDRESDEYKREPFAADVSEGKNDPIYKAHSYHTKVPHKAIMRYILHYTEPGDTVFDGFCGTGMTGVAAQLCGDKTTVQSLGYSVQDDGTVRDEHGVVLARLGVRRAILNDLSPAATFIAHNYNAPLDSHRFERAAKRLLDEVESECGWMYLTLHDPTSAQLDEALALLDAPGPDLRERAPHLPWAKQNYTVWSDVYACPDCGGEIVFLEHAFDHSKGHVREQFPCPSCLASLKKSDLSLLYESAFDDAVGAVEEQPRRVPVLVEYEIGKAKRQKPVDAFDRRLTEVVATGQWWRGVPTNALPDMQMARVGRMRTARVRHWPGPFLSTALDVRVSSC